MNIVPNFKSYKEIARKYSESMQQEKRQKFVAYIYIVLTLFTISFFGLFAIMPTISTISNLDKQYKDNLLVYESLKEKLSALQKLDQQYFEIQPDLELIYSAIPKTNRIPYLTRQIETLASVHNLTITHLEFGPIELSPIKKTEPSMYSFTFDISIEGNDFEVNNFIEDFINFDRIVALNHLVSGKTDKKYGATIGGKAYFSSL